MGGNIPGGSFPGKNFVGRSLMGENFPGGNFPWGIFLVTKLFTDFFSFTAHYNLPLCRFYLSTCLLWKVSKYYCLTYFSFANNFSLFMFLHDPIGLYR